MAQTRRPGMRAERAQPSKAPRFSYHCEGIAARWAFKRSLSFVVRRCRSVGIFRLGEVLRRKRQANAIRPGDPGHARSVLFGI
jgi:hypothetical protein